MVEQEAGSARLVDTWERLGDPVQAHRGGRVAAVACSPRGRVKMTTGSLTDLVRAWTPFAQFDSVPMRLREVVADDLLVFHHPFADRALEPIREPFVQIRSIRLAEGVVRGVAQQDVPEPIGLDHAECRRLGRQQLAPDEGEKRGGHLGTGCRWGQFGDLHLVELAAHDRRPLGQRALRRRQSVDAGGHQRLDRRRDLDRVGVERPSRRQRASSRPRRACPPSPGRTAGCPRRWPGCVREAATGSTHFRATHRRGPRPRPWGGHRARSWSPRDAHDPNACRGPATRAASSRGRARARRGRDRRSDRADRGTWAPPSGCPR